MPWKLEVALAVRIVNLGGVGVDKRRQESEFFHISHHGWEDKTILCILCIFKPHLPL